MIGWIAFVLILLVVSGLWAADRAGKRVLAEREAAAAARPPEPKPARRRIKVGGSGEVVDL